MPERTHQNFFLPQYQSALGTAVHATPLVEALKAALPDSRIIVAANGMAAQVWEGNPHIERLLHTPNPLQDTLAAILTLRRARLFAGEPYFTLLTTGNERTRVTLAAVFSGSSKRIGFAVHGVLVQQHLQFDPALSQIRNNLRLLEAAGVPSPNTPTKPRLYPEAAAGYASDLLAGTPRPCIAFATQTSPTQRKSWPNERWVELACRLRARYAAELVFVGAPSETAAIESIRSRLSFSTISVAGKTTIQQLAAILSECDFAVTLDTGPLHVARGVDLPAVVIAPAWSPIHEWLPVGNPRYRILKNADFPPPAPEDYVITEVSVDDVLEAVEDLFASKNSAGAEAGRIQES